MNRETAAELSVSEETVKSHVKRIREKLGARNITHAVGIAYRTGLLDPAFPGREVAEHRRLSELVDGAERTAAQFESLVEDLGGWVRALNRFRVPERARPVRDGDRAPDLVAREYA